MLKFIKYCWPPLLIALVIFYLCCLIPSDDIPAFDWNLPVEKDKVVHFLMYFGLSIVASFNYILIKQGNIIILKMIAFAVLLPIIYSGVIELLQANYFNRAGDWYDLLANALGSLLTIPLSLWLRRFLLNKQDNQDI